MAAGVALFATAGAVIVGSLLYIRLAPKTYSSMTRIIISQPTSNSIPQLNQLMLDVTRKHRDVSVRHGNGSSLFEIVTFAHGPETAATLANECARDIAGLARARLNANTTVLESATPQPRPVRPAASRIMVLAIVVSLNLFVACLTCLIVARVAAKKGAAQTAVTAALA
jgi:capsular polysaccharide biosynthesis protein